MLKLAHVLQTTGKYDRAVILLDATRDELRGLPAGTPLRDLPWRLEEGYGYLLYQRGDLAKSLERYRAASTLQASDASLERIDSIRVQLGMALVENALRRFEDAAQRMLPLIAELDRNHGPMAPDTLRCRNELARAYLGQGDYSKALSVQSEVVAAAQASGSAIETQLAQAFEIRMLVGLERYREAEELARSTLEFFSRQQSGPTRFTERLRALLAEITLATGRYAEAREYARQALDNQSRLFEPESPQIAQTLDVVGAIERAAGRPLDAEPPLARAQAIHVRQLGATHVYALRNALYLAISRVALQRPDAQAQFESAQRQLSAALPSMHPAQRQIARAVEAAQLAAGAHQPALVTRAELARFFLIDL